MRILLKYTLKSMGEKKFRSFLIIFAISLAGALFLASTRLSTTITDIYMDQMKEYNGDIDLQVWPGEKAKSDSLLLSDFNFLKDKAMYIIPEMYVTAEYKDPKGTKSSIQITACNFEDYVNINKLDIVEGNIDHIKAEYPIILSKQTADKLGFKLNQEFKVKISNGNCQTTRKVKIVALVRQKGIFKGESQGMMGLMPFDTISRMMKLKGRAPSVVIKVKDDVNPEEVMNLIQTQCPKDEVYMPYDPAGLQEELSQITDPFMLMTGIVIFMSIFIIYSSFKVIMMEKLPTVGTFRSVGATKGIMNLVLMLESVLYGVFGGIFACLLGKGCLYGLTTLMMNMLMGEGEQISVTIPMQVYVSTFLSSAIVAVCSTLIPIFSVSRISLKDIILNNRPHKSMKYIKSTIIGAGIIAAGFILPKISPMNFLMLTSVLGLFMVIFGIIFVLPLFVLIVSQFLGIVFKIVFGNIGELATKNIKKNKSVLNSITLITIGISVLLMISTMTDNMMTQILDIYHTTFHCDVIGYMSDLDRQMLNKIKRIDGIGEIKTTIEPQIKVKQLDNTQLNGIAVEDTKLSPAIMLNLKNEEEILKKLQSGRNVILSTKLKKQFNLKTGDKITLPFEKKDRSYTIIGFTNSSWSSDLAILPLKYYKLDAGQKDYDYMYITAKPGADKEKIVSELEEFADKQEEYFYGNTVDNYAQRNLQNIQQLMGLINIFAILAMVIGIVGIINNLFISFMERKQNIAMLRSIGMSKMQVLKMILVEGIGSGTIGGIGGIMGGSLVCLVCNYIMEAMDMPITVYVEPALFPKFFIGGLLITVIGSIIPARGSSKLNIIEAIKYE